MVSTITPELKESNKNPKNFHVKKWKSFPENSLGKIGSLISQCGELKKFLEENGNPGWFAEKLSELSDNSPGPGK